MQVNFTTKRFWQVFDLAFEACREVRLLLDTCLPVSINITDEFFINPAEETIDKFAAFHHVKNHFTENRLTMNLAIDVEQELPFSCVLVNFRKLSHISDIKPQHKGFLLDPSFFFEVGDLNVLGLRLVL